MNLTAQQAASHSPLPVHQAPGSALPLEAAIGLLLVGGAVRALARRPGWTAAGWTGQL